jgi:hypothetical protein
MQGSYRDAAKAATSILLNKREQLILREKRNPSHLGESSELRPNQTNLLLGYNRDQEFSSVSAIRAFPRRSEAYDAPHFICEFSMPATVGDRLRKPKVA